MCTCLCSFFTTDQSQQTGWRITGVLFEVLFLLKAAILGMEQGGAEIYRKQFCVKNVGAKLQDEKHLRKLRKIFLRIYLQTGERDLATLYYVDKGAIFFFLIPIQHHTVYTVVDGLLSFVQNAVSSVVNLCLFVQLFLTEPSNYKFKQNVASHVNLIRIQKITAVCGGSDLNVGSRKRVGNL